MNSRLERDGGLGRLEGDEGLERDDVCPDRLLERPEGPGRLERFLGVLSASENETAKSKVRRKTMEIIGSQGDIEAYE